MNGRKLGRQNDPTSRLYNYGYRDYAPQSARFTTVDPIRDDSNWFIYCNDDPINYIDSAGLFGVATITGTIFGGASGSITESKINGESINSENVLCDAAIGSFSALLGYGAGKIINNISTRKAAEMLMNPTKEIGKEVLVKLSQKTGEVYVEIGKNIDKTIITGVDRVINAGLTIGTDIFQDQTNPNMNNRGENENNNSGKLDNKSH